MRLGGSREGRERQHQELVPVVAREIGAGPVGRVHGLALVQLEMAVAVGILDDPRVLVLRLHFFQHLLAVGCLDGADRQGQQERECRGNEHRPPAGNADNGDHGAGERKGQERAARSERRGSAATLPAMPPQGFRPLRSRRCGRRRRLPLRSAPRQAGSRRARRPRAASPAAPPARSPQSAIRKRRRPVTSSSASTDTSRNGSARNGISPTASAATSTSVQRPRRCGWRSAKLPPDPVAERKRDQHDADDVRPHHRRGAEEGRQQPRGRNLGAEHGRADHEHEQLEGREFAVECSPHVLT